MMPEIFAWAVLSATAASIITMYATGYLRFNWTDNALFIVVVNFVFFAMWLFVRDNVTWFVWCSLMCFAMASGAQKSYRWKLRNRSAAQ